MSKSLGNVVTLRNVLDVWGREVLLLYHMSGHWRKPVDFTDESLESARTQVESFRNVFRDPPPRVGATPSWDDFVAALENDFNTPEALSIMHSWRRHGFVDWLEDALGTFGLESLATDAAAPAAVHDLARQRAEARAAKDYAKADELRDDILAQGWVVRDLEAEPGYRLVRT
jgi:cysteinyl-tRNA synthetase